MAPARSHKPSDVGSNPTHCYSQHVVCLMLALIRCRRTETLVQLQKVTPRGRGSSLEVERCETSFVHVVQ